MRYVASIIALSILLAACGGADSAPAPMPGPRPTATPAPAASFQYAPCNFDVPEGQIDGRTISCGYLVVPENRLNPEGAQIRLFVAVLRATIADEAADPVIYLAGGPGGSASRIDIQYFTSAFAQQMQERRDLVFFDQRGVGLSTPSLDCPELRKYRYYPLEYDEAMRLCHDRVMTQNMDLTQYTSEQNAADIVDLAQQLGYDTYNLYGVSYGTRLALTAMRDAPQKIRSVVLDSSLPLQANLYAERGLALEQTLLALFDACAAAPSCREFAPDLRGTFFNLLARFEASPIAIDVSDPYSNDRFQILVDGDVFVEIVINGFGVPGVVERLPAGIMQVAEGDYRMISTIASIAYGREIGIARGFYYTVQCAEEMPFNTPDTVRRPQNAALGRLLDAATDSLDGMTATCAIWNVPAKGPHENLPVVSDIPTLVLAGQYDAITPPLYGRMAAETLSRSTYVEFPWKGHAVIDEGCPMTIVVAFLDNPEAAPDTSCIAAMESPAFTR